MEFELYDIAISAAVLTSGIIFLYKKYCEREAAKKVRANIDTTLSEEEIKPQALLAMHDSLFDGTLTRYLRYSGYEVVKAGSVDEMLDEMGIPSDSPADCPPTNQFEWYIMDVNLGTKGGDSYDPALTIYQHVKPDVESGKSRFMAVSGNPDAVEDANAAEIPCSLKTGIKTLMNLIRES